MEFHDDCVFTLNPLDSSGVVDLTFVGHAKHGRGFPVGNRAADGAPGRNAKDPKLFKTSGNKADRGGAGKNGGDGHYGEDAVDFIVHFPSIPPGAKVSFNSVGGDGGRGQDGGNGGKGGDRSTFHDGRNGGSGGDGGDGGASGDAGKVFVFAVIADDDFKELAEKKDYLKAVSFSLNCATGIPGAPGSNGSGGQPGKGAHLGGSLLNAGPDGKDGQMGPRGDGPDQSDSSTDWVQFDVLTSTAYSQWIAQQMATLNG